MSVLAITRKEHREKDREYENIRFKKQSTMEMSQSNIDRDQDIWKNKKVNLDLLIIYF